jgi:hypothetical protein
MAGLSSLNNIIGPNIGIIVVVISLLLIGGIVIGVIALVKSSSSHPSSSPHPSSPHPSSSNLSKYIKATDKSIVIGLDDSQKIVLKGNVDMTTGDVNLGNSKNSCTIEGKNIDIGMGGDSNSILNIGSPKSSKLFLDSKDIYIGTQPNPISSGNGNEVIIGKGAHGNSIKGVAISGRNIWNNLPNGKTVDTSHFAL